MQTETEGIALRSELQIPASAFRARKSDSYQKYRKKNDDIKMKQCGNSQEKPASNAAE